VSWTSLMCGFLQSGNANGSLSLFCQMGLAGVKPNEFTFSTNIKACGVTSVSENGMQIHGLCVKTGFDLVTVVGNSIIDMYGKCGRINEAARMFYLMPDRNLISWNAMIGGYITAGYAENALLLFIFDQIETENVISWSALILGYAQAGNLEEALDLFRQLRDRGIQVDGFVLSSMMGVFADFALVEQGKQMHAYNIKVPAGLEISVCNSILDMYLKGGLMDDAEKHFNEMPVRNLISWTVMITGYGKHGLGREAIRLFKKMQSQNIEPDDVTYLAILSACSHSGLIEESQEFYSSLCQNKQIKLRVEHCACMVDLLGRAGRIKEAKNLIDSLPLKTNAGIWQTLLSACRVHGDLELGREVGEILLRMDGNNPVNYIMLSNIYADAGYWKECQRIRELVKAKGLKKEAGRSWVEIDGVLQFFYGGDDTHQQMEKIHKLLKEMEKRMKEDSGYVYGVKFALHDVEEESKEKLEGHSEKLAIGLALVHGGLNEEGRVIRIFKNLRVCGDCHEFIKGLSKILKMVFLVRDANRFHRFKDGLCSCGDYW
ncbi:LOW QUALITY PROTEIN: PPR domain-containing protein/PPR_2 domain-containing protein/DYW_deaminase domain-containing protein, partial [Cephalotus follicularis]